MNKRNAVVILSGGQDSTTCLYYALQNYDNVSAVIFDYGQRHIIEVMSAIRITKIAGIRYTCRNLRTVLDSTSPLVDLTKKLDTYESFEAMEKEVGDKVEKTFVPMRNAMFIVAAANAAVCNNAGTIITGICESDNANYPDCTNAFKNSIESMINVSLGVPEKTIEIVTPLINLTKADTVKLAASMKGCGYALAYSHTSYGGEYPPIQQNHSNLLRAEGFLRANMPDPLIVRAVLESRMEFPITDNYARAADIWDSLKRRPVNNNDEYLQYILKECGYE